MSLCRVGVLSRHLLLAVGSRASRQIASAAHGRAPASMAAPPPHLGRLHAGATALFVCDVQERFRAVIAGFPAVADAAARMARAAAALPLPVIVTEQYPEKLGATVAEVAGALPAGGGAAAVVAKTRFSMCVPEVTAALGGLPFAADPRRAVLLVGIEAHVCVLQTALDLLEAGWAVHVLVDGVSSQRITDRAAALRRLAAAGAHLSTTEMALFELMRGTSHPAFKAVSALVKEPRPEPLPPV